MSHSRRHLLMCLRDLGGFCRRVYKAVRQRPFKRTFFSLTGVSAHHYVKEGTTTGMSKWRILSVTPAHCTFKLSMRGAGTHCRGLEADTHFFHLVVQSYFDSPSGLTTCSQTSTLRYVSGNLADALIQQLPSHF